MGIAVMAADIGKGVVAVLLARAITDDPWPAIAAGAAMAGHVFPVWLRLQGRQGRRGRRRRRHRADAPGRLILLRFWLVVVLISRYTSLGAILGSIAAVPVVWALGYSTSNIVFTAVAAAAVLLLHRGNIVRLLQGRENRIDLSRRAGRRGPEART